MNGYDLSIRAFGTAPDTATVTVAGPLGGTRWVAELTEPVLRRVALEFEAAADMLAEPTRTSVRCVCVSLHHGSPGRCTGIGDKANSGCCYGCRTPEWGTVGPPEGPPDHRPIGAWPTE